MVTHRQSRGLLRQYLLAATDIGLRLERVDISSDCIGCLVLPPLVGIHRRKRVPIFIIGRLKVSLLRVPHVVRPAMLSGLGTPGSA